MFLHNSDRRRAQISRARIVAEPLPRAENVTFRGRGKSNCVGKTAEPFIIIRDDGGDLSLLKHDLGDEDRVRIGGAAPGKIAAFFSVPRDKRAAEGASGIRVHVDKENLERPTPNVQRRISESYIRYWTLGVGRSTFAPFPAMTSYTHPLTTEQTAKLRNLLRDLGFEFAERPHTLFFAQKNKLSAAVYEKGPKILLQGKGIEEFVQFELEPKILEEAKLGYEEVHSPEMFEPHFGIDESGKGDFFGPLVIAGVYVDREIARKFLEAGIQDSKRIGSDPKIRSLAELIRTTPDAVGDTVALWTE